MDKTSIELSTEIAMIMLFSILLKDYICIDNY